MVNLKSIIACIFILNAIYLPVLAKNTSIESSIKPLGFIPNKGQWDDKILYRNTSASLDFIVQNDGISLYFFEAFTFNHNHFIKNRDSAQIRGHCIRLEFINADFSKSVPEISSSAYYNYFLGNDTTKWRSGIHAYEKIIFKSIYAGIDLIFYTNKYGEFEFDYQLASGANPKQIVIKVNGSERIYEQDGDINISYHLGLIHLKKPLAYQNIGSVKRIIPSKYELDESNIKFNLGNYDKNSPLLIDPELIFSTYSGSSVDNFGFTATYDNQGNLYAGGIALAPSVIINGKYPVTSGAFQLNWKNGSFTEVFIPKEASNYLPACDITLSKYSPDGKTLLFATYLGGSGNEHPHSLVCDPQGNLIVLGSSNSSDFPVSLNAYDTTANGNFDIVLSKFSNDGKRLIGSSYLGGTNDDGINRADGLLYFYGDNFRGDIISDPTGKIYVASFTLSADFPAASNGFSKSQAGLQDGILYCFDSSFSQLIWGNFIGGENEDALYSVDIDSKQQLWVCGGTRSHAIPMQTQAWKATHTSQDSTDGFIYCISNNGQQMLHSTYFGYKGYDQTFFLELDQNNQSNVWVCGQTENNLNAVGNTYFQKNGKQFIICFDTALKTMQKVSVFGSGRAKADLTINAFLVDDCGRIYISGWGDSDLNSGNINGLSVTNDAFRKTTNNGDFYLALFNADVKSLLYATYFGGLQTNDHVDGGTSRFDKNGIIYQSVCASCPDAGHSFISDFPTTTGAYAVTNKSPRCSNASFKFDFRLKQAQYEIQIDTCNRIIYLKNKTIGASHILWLFPDQTTSSDEIPTFTFTKALSSPFSILLIAEPGTLCADTAEITVNMNDSIIAPFIPNVFTPGNDQFNDRFYFPGLKGPCDSFYIQILNRWGEEVYTSTSASEGWNGNDHNTGNQISEGVYFYMIHLERFNGQKYDYRGTVQLKR